MRALFALCIKAFRFGLLIHLIKISYFNVTAKIRSAAAVVNKERGSCTALKVETTSISKNVQKSSSTMWQDIESDTLCQWRKEKEVKTEMPDVYWVNKDESYQRKSNMETMFSKIGYQNHFRVKGLSVSSGDIHVSDDRMRSWRMDNCTSLSPEGTQESESDSAGRRLLRRLTQSSDEKLNDTLNSTSAMRSSPERSTVTISSLCTLDKEQDKKVLGCTVSHLVAIQQTVEAYRAPKKNDKNRPFMSRYALIMEDDVFIPFNINWPMLVQSAPKDFGILQLFNSQIYLLNNTWNAYLNAPYVENNTLWLPREVGSDFWSTCAYLIDRQALKPIIESVVTKETGGGRLTMSIIAGSKDGSRPVEYTWDGVPPPSDKHHHHHSHHHKSSSSSDKSKHKHKEKEKKEKKAKDKHKEKRGRDSDSDGDNEPRRQLRAIYPTGPCFPKSCCGGSLNVTKESPAAFKAPCIHSPKGLQADAYIYSFVPTYVLAVPIISNGFGGAKSTLHQDHVSSVHRASFQAMREKINQMLSCTVTPPAFMMPACTALNVTQL